MASGKIFISYRREDTSGESGRLKDKLEQVFGQDNIFYDVETLEAGLNFDESIAKALGESKVLLAMIGPHWLKVVDSKGIARLQKPDDWVRKEITEALKRNLRVIPILVNGAEMPNPEDLPEDLKELSLKHAQELSSSRWNYDVGELSKVLEKIVTKKPGPQPRPNQNTFTPPIPQPKGWWAKNYLWMIGGLVGFLILVGMCAPDEEYINPIDQDSIARDQLVQDAEALVETSPNQDPGVTNPEGNEIYESLTLDSEGGTDTNQSVHDMAGEWSLYLNGQKVSIFAFNQDGPNVAYYEYDLLNQRTAEGKGQIDGEYLAMDYYSTATDIAGTISLSTDNQGQTWIGTIYFPSNGVTAEVKLTR